LGNAVSSHAVLTFPRPLKRRPLPLPDRLPRPLPELALVVAVYAGYKYGRKVASGHTGKAYDHAHAVWGLERALHLPSERLVQRAAMHWEPVIHAANYLYATVHFPAMALFLGYMFLRDRAHYLWIRRAIVIQTALALVGHLLYPLAPPRLLAGSGMVDTAARFGPAVYHGRPQEHSLANQFAAMPSLHVGWALAIAVGMIAAHRSRWRFLWLLHPLVTLLVVVGTANHYWLDGIVGSALLGLAVLIIPAPAPDTAVRSDTHWLWPLVPGHRPGRRAFPRRGPRTRTRKGPRPQQQREPGAAYARQAPGAPDGRYVSGGPDGRRPEAPPDGAGIGSGYDSDTGPARDRAGDPRATAPRSG
jgi:hypothetical protein